MYGLEEERVGERWRVVVGWGRGGGGKWFFVINSDGGGLGVVFCNFLGFG